MGILDFFPKTKTPRPQQIDILKAIEANWNKGEILVIEAPTGVGKSAIAMTVAEWQKAISKNYSVILTPNNLLTQQYHSDYPKMAAYYGKDFQKCKDPNFQSCKDKYDYCKSSKQKKMYCEGCPYKTSHARVERLPFKFNYIANYYKYVQLKRSSEGKANRDILIIDEAHLLIDTIKSFNTQSIWLHDFNYREYPDRDSLLKGLKSVYKDKNGDNIFQDFIDAIEMNPPRYVLKETEELYHGHIKKKLIAYPISIKGLNNPIVNSAVSKIIMLSATISQKDIEEMGLAGKRLVYLKSDSCIPVENRPVVWYPTVWVNSSNLREATDTISHRINEIAARYPEEKGLIHVTYQQARIIRELGILKGDRFIYHDKDNKREVYEDFRQRTDNSILVASGMYEGIDLPYDAGRWQVIAKIPFPSLGEPAVRYQVNRDKEWYHWQAIKTVLQAAGRICRAPDDFGITYILDDTFENLYSTNYRLFPGWFQEAVSQQVTEE